mmetsp:Transcript_6680/g.17085  ORF Transcript_6680/g.17085 Transcript_6680/m.17085 type:complete len:91 (+) Transcript_6680:3-275(+)
MVDSTPPEQGEQPASSPLESLQRVLQSPAVALTASVILLTVLIFNRFVVDEVANSQSRSDLLATAAVAVVALNALSSLDIESRAADQADL